MVPRLKYDVIHSIRVAFLNDRNPARSARVAREYLARLPRGTSRGPEPTSIAPWVKSVDGPSLAATHEVGNDGSNFASKGFAIRLDARPGGICADLGRVRPRHDDAPGGGLERGGVHRRELPQENSQENRPCNRQIR